MAATPEYPSLTLLGGPLGGQHFVFDEGVESVLIGSDPSCGFRIELPGISPIHARVRAEPEGLVVFDTQSPRGLYVNDDRVESQVPLRNGDVLWLGKPGEAGVIMIQCRVPPRSAASAIPLPPPAAEPAEP
jgi:pSer/pThr/pTyr-binding forkhead associated (FHA) protein